MCQQIGIRIRSDILVTLSVFSLLLLQASRLVAQEGTPSSPVDHTPVEHLWRSVQQYRVIVGEESPEEGRLIDTPVLRWNNPVSGIQDGLVVMWVDAAGRPAIAAQVFKTRTNYGLHEFQSLSEHPLQVKQDEKTLWHPDRGGVEYAPLPGPPPVVSRAGRLIQMRALANQFQASVRFKDRQATGSTTRYELRLLRQPVYRYKPAEDTLLDGAVFAFVQGTNPEALLILEVDSKQAEQPSWKYALAPMTAYEVAVTHETVGAWEAKNRQAISKIPTEPFFIAHFEKPARD